MASRPISIVESRPAVDRPTAPMRRRLTGPGLRMVLVLGVHAAAMAVFLGAPSARLADRPSQIVDVRLIESPPVPELPQPLLPRVSTVPRPRPAPVEAVPQVLAVMTATVTDAPAPMTGSPPADPTPLAVSPALQPSPGPATAPPPLPVSPARFDADYLNNPAPVYPLTSRLMKEQGTVLLWVDVSAQGDAERVRVHQSSGRPRLDEAALDAVRRWRFVPARRGSQAMAASVIVPIVFELDR